MENTRRRRPRLTPAEACSVSMWKHTASPGSSAQPRMGKSCRRAFPGDDAEHQENAAANDVEGENLPKRLRIGDKAVEAKTHQRRPDEPGQRRRDHRPGSRRGGPATSIGRVTAIVSVMKISMKRIKGLANSGG